MPRIAHRLSVSSSKMVDIDTRGEVTVYGTFTPDEVASLVQAAYRLGLSHEEVSK